MAKKKAGAKDQADICHTFARNNIERGMLAAWLTVGHAITVKVRWFDAKGHAKPLSGAVVNGKRTNHHGIVQIVPTKAGKLTLHASKHGYIRDETSVHVS